MITMNDGASWPKTYTVEQRRVLSQKRGSKSKHRRWAQFRMNRPEKLDSFERGWDKWNQLLARLA